MNARRGMSDQNNSEVLFANHCDDKTHKVGFTVSSSRDEAPKNEEEDGQSTKK